MPILMPIFIALGASFEVYAAVVTALEMIALMLVSKLLAPKSSQGTQLSDGVTQEYSGTVEPRRIVYGSNLVSGLNAIPPWCHGQNNALLDQVLVLAGHEVTSITDIYANQELILSKNIGSITQSANDGKVGTGTFANKLWLRRHTGAPAEQIDFILYQAWPASWDINHMGRGLAKLFIQYQYDATVYSGGKPEIRCMVKGKKCYDPRLDTLPGANSTNIAYQIFTANPALCIVDYLLDPILGLGEAPSRIDWTMAVAAANCCDEQVAVPLLLSLIPAYDPLTTYYFGDQVQQGGVVYDCVHTTSIVNLAPPNVLYWNPLGTGSLTQPRYTCNTVLDCTLAYEENIKTLAASMQGAVLYSSGKWVLYPGKWQTPSFSVGDDDISGAIDYQTAIPYADRYNAVRGQFYDPTNLYQPGEYPAIEVMADEIADGEGPVWRELQQPHCIDIFEAQRNAIILQRKSRRKKTWAFPATYGMWGIRPGDFGTLTITELGVVGQYVRCTGWKMDGKAMSVQLTLEEVNSADWFDPATVIYQTATNLSSPAGATFTSDPVTALTGLGGAGGITFRWTMPSIWHSNLTIELLESDLNILGNAVVIWSGVNTGVFIQKYDTTTRYYWVRVRNFAGNTVSSPMPPLLGLAASAVSAQVGPPGPAGPPGTTGDGGLVGSLSLPAIVLPADAYGNVTDYSAAVGNFVVFLGTVDVTAQCIFALGPSGNPSGLTFTIDGKAGEASEGVLFTSQSQTTVGVSVMVNLTGTGATSQVQTTLAAGTGAPITWDSSTLTWDSSHLWSDNAMATFAQVPVAVSGVGVTAQGERSTAAGLNMPPSVPSGPTIGTATAGIGSVAVSFAANWDGGSPITSYVVTATPGGATVLGAASPITVSGLSAATSYSFTVKAVNAMGSSTASAVSNSVTPTVTIPAGASVLGYTHSQFNFAPMPSDLNYTNDPAQKLFVGLYYNAKPPVNLAGAVTVVNGVMSLNNLGGGGWSSPVFTTETQNSVTGSLGYLDARIGFYCEWEEAISDIDPDHFEAMWLLPQEHADGTKNYVEIDVHEGGMRGLETMFSTAILWVDSAPNQKNTNWSSWNSPNPIIDRTKFNRYGVSYSPTLKQIKYYINDVLNLTVDTTKVNVSGVAQGITMESAIQGAPHYYMITWAQTHGANKPYSMYIRNMQAWTPPVAPVPGYDGTIKVSGNKFVNGSGAVVQLRGANMSALEYTAIQGWSPGDPWGGSGQAPNWATYKTFKPNCVRLPLNVASWMGYTVAPTASATTWGSTRSADPGGNYRATVIQAVADAQANGCYVILDLHWTSPLLTLGSVTNYLANTGQSAFADATAIPFWTSIAQTFGTQATPPPGVNNAGVLFELFNEPYAKSFSGTCTTGPNGTGTPITDKDVLLRTGGYSNQCVNQSQGGANFSLAVNWQIVGYQAMLDAIRATGAKNVCIANGNDYAQSLKPYASFKPVDTLNQLAIGWHPYPNRYQTNCTITSGNPSIVASTSLAAGQPVGFTGSVGNIAVDTTYYVSATGLSGSALQICATPGGAVIVPNASGNVGLNRNHYPYTNYGPIPVCGSDNGYAAPTANDVQYANAVLAGGLPVICTEYGGEGGTSRTNVPPEPMVNFVQQWADTSGASALIWQFNNPRAYNTASSTYYCTALDSTGKQVAIQGCGTNWESWMKGHA